MTSALLRNLVFVLGLVSASIIHAQPGAEERLRFDVVSVKPNKSGDVSMRLDIQPSGRLVAINIPLKQFVRAAYALQLYQIAEAPAWLDSERFDITATTERDLGGVVWTPGKFAPVQLMMQSVMTDRFKMAAHTERREAQTYGLVVQPGGSGKMIVGKGECPPNCAMKIAHGSLTAQNIPLAQFVEFLSQITGRLVVDSTGLSGNFDIDLRWAPESQQGLGDGPSVFTALQEQLGLRLEPRRAFIPQLVIDSIERPTAD